MAKMSLKKIFCVTYGGGHANIVRLVAQSIQDKYRVNILALTCAPQVLDKSKLKYKTIKDYLFLFEKDKKIILSYGKELYNYMKNDIDLKIDYDDSIAYLGLGFWNLVYKCASEEKAFKLFTEKGRYVFCPTLVLERILRYENPNIVLLTAGVRYEAAAGMVSNYMNIPVVHINDLVEMLPISYQADICVMNENTRQFIINNKIADPVRIHVTGQPVMENSLIIDKEKQEKIKEYLKINRYKNIILYIEQPCNKDIDLIENCLYKQSLEHPENMYICKLHPNQKFPETHYIKNNFCKTKDVDLKYLNNIATVVITCDSTGGLEAALMGKPLIVVGINQNIGMDFSKHGIALKTTNLEELKNILQEISVIDEKFELNIGRMRFQNKKNSLINIQGVIDKLVR